MAGKHSARAALRSATAPHHARVDAVFSACDLSNRAAYGRFLSAQAAAHLPVEQELTKSGAAAVLPDWAERQRAPLLLADLAALGLPVPEAEPAPSFDGSAAVLGGVYVLEGSRLGGTLLRRAVAPGLPSSFLGASDSAAWRGLLELLDVQLQGDIERAFAVAAAIEVFTVFERSAQLHLGTD